MFASIVPGTRKLPGGAGRCHSFEGQQDFVSQPTLGVPVAVECIFCRIASGEIPARLVYEDADTMAFRDINPQAPTHVLVIPRRHIASMNDLQPEDAELMGRLILAAGEIARKEGIASGGYRLVMNTGAAAGQTVDHIHVHLLGGRHMKWPPG
jgi:histidine triad (HIT) family protein